jgi:hypothetical protein
MVHQMYSDELCVFAIISAATTTQHMPGYEQAVTYHCFPNTQQPRSVGTEGTGTMRLEQHEQTQSRDIR